MELTEIEVFEDQSVIMETEMLMSLKYKNAYKSNTPNGSVSYPSNSRIRALLAERG